MTSFYRKHFFLLQGVFFSFFAISIFLMLPHIEDRSRLFQILPALGGLYLVFFLLTYRFYTFVSGHFMSFKQNFIESTKQISTGKLDNMEQYLPFVKDNKEFEELTAAYNKMLREIRKSVFCIESQVRIGKALATEHDSYMLFHTILHYAKALTGADGGSIFIIEPGDKNNPPGLCFKYSRTFSRNLPYEEFSIPLDTSSIAGYVAVTGTPLNIPDVYEIPGDAPYRFNQEFDRHNNYRSKSMLVIPMKNHNGEINGVLELINSKEKNDTFRGDESYKIFLEKEDDFDNLVGPFTEDHLRLIEGVAGQAGIALENVMNLERIESLFGEFIKAAIGAIESRDPATSGHSFRVAGYSLEIARAINNARSGPFASLTFSHEELRELVFASLLHDFGKLYIDPEVFLKSRRFYSKDYRYWKMKLNFIYKSIELRYTRLKEELKTAATRDPKHLEALEQEEKDRKEALETLKVLMEELIDPSSPLTAREEILANIREIEPMLTARDLDGEIVPILDDGEWTNLGIPRGTLNQEERRSIENHVSFSYAFTSKIPWPRNYERIPEIIKDHHEKLDGSGYPQGKKGKANILLQTRIITVADIFDALAAKDRPYKKEMPMENVLSILRKEGEEGKLDLDVVDLFIEQKVYEKESIIEI